MTHIEQQHKPFLTLSAKPRVADSRLNSPVVYYGLADNSVCQVDLEKGKIVQKRENTHEGKIGCIRFKEEMLMTGGYDNMLRLYDPRSLQIVHSFQSIIHVMQKSLESSTVWTRPSTSWLPRATLISYSGISAK